MRVLAITLAVASIATAAEEPALREAAARAIGALERGSRNWFQKQTCFSCHHQALPLLAVGAARARGVKVDEAHWSGVVKKAARLGELDRAVQYHDKIDPAMSDGYTLLALRSAGVQRTLTTAVYARHIAGHQRPSGQWETLDFRPPQTGGRFTATAIALRAIQLFGRDSTEASVTRARQWLESARPSNTEDRTFRLIGLHWASAAKATIASAAQELRESQRSDGGWAQLPSFGSDAYATGQALWALRESGQIQPDDPAFSRGADFLLRTQKPDGSWHVRTRIHPPAPLSPPYFETGFPYRKDQFVSASATAWAALALLSPITPQSGPPQPLGDIAATPAPDWVETALFGTAAELGVLLDLGLDPNAKTADGTTLLMMAVPDVPKTRLLLDRGADVRAKSKTGWTALMNAAQYSGAAEVVRLLLAKGAEAKPGFGVRYNASPLALAAFTGDTEVARVLLDNGADPRRRMLLLGIFPIPAFDLSVAHGDTALAEVFVKAGVDVNAPDAGGMYQLGWSSIGGYTDMLRLLVKSGADIHKADKLKMTPLDYAATYYHGHTGVVEALLAAGARPSSHTVALAKKYGHADISQALERKR